MSDELFPEIAEINTPETLGVTPRYVLQHNAISRSIHDLSATAKKLTAMAMALIPADMSSLTASFTFADFCKAIGYDKGGESFKLFLSATKECMKNIISIEMVSAKTGKKKWKNYTWFSSSEFDEETGIATMKFAPELAAILLELKRVYAKINLADLGKLQSKYALRIYEMAVSYSSLKGKDGNSSDEWYFEREVQNLRKILGVSGDIYTETKRFRQKVVEEPIREINQAGIGLEITTESIKQGRKLAAIRFNCKAAARTISKRRGRKKAEKPALELPKINPKTAGLREEKENQHLKELYPDEFAAHYTAALSRPRHGVVSLNLALIAAEAEALGMLREFHGIVK
ncbi:replication protein [Bacteroidales bacterium Barb4]|nr:replication protein [Bacteroidales bacterium Barb4]